MKSLYFGVALSLTFIGGILVAQPTFASTEDTNISTVATRPSRLQIEQAILKVRGIGDYETYFPVIDSPALTSTVEFYQEYNYLHHLVTTGHKFLADFDSISADFLNDFIAATNDAEIACNLKFGIVRRQNQQATSTENTTSSPVSPTVNTSNTSAASTPATNTENTTTTKAVTEPHAATSTSTQPATIATTTPSPDIAITKITDEPTNDTAPSAPAVSQSEQISESAESIDSSSLPNLLAHGSTAAITTCLLGTAVISERRTHRPGRRK